MSTLTEELITQASAHLAEGRLGVAVIGVGPEALEIKSAVEGFGGSAAIFDPRERQGTRQWTPWDELAASEPELVIIAADEEKEVLLRAAADVLDQSTPLPRVVLAGLGHQEVADELFEKLEAPALVPSYATGHPNTRRHLYDCLRSAAAHGRSGAIVELGAFKGGTSVWLAKAVQGLGLRDCPVIGFDAWDGFPQRRSLLDLYEHPRCIFRDFDAVRAYTEPYGIELVAGDIFETAPRRLANQPILLAFIDTDNYSGTRAALKSIIANLVPSGAIVFDHYFTIPDYVYTVGERIAANEAVCDAGLLHLSGTGVFINVA